CPYARWLSIACFIAIPTPLAARNGLLVRNRRGLEEARSLHAVVFDKTGTLTRGEFGVVSITTIEGLAPEEALRLAAAVERDSEHSIAQGVVRSAEDRKLAVPQGEQFEAISGKGARARVNGRQLYVGGPALLQALGIALPESLRRAALDAGNRGQSAIYLVDETKVQAVFAVADVVRPESYEAVRLL